jgi:pimeloyl-ACP methyl ester carboxylesterase
MVVDTVAEQVVATAHAAGVGDFVVVGTSSAAAVAIKVAAHHLGHVWGLVTVGGWAYARTTLRLSLELWASMYARNDENLAKLGGSAASVAISLPASWNAGYTASVRR